MGHCSSAVLHAQFESATPDGCIRAFGRDTDSYQSIWHEGCVTRAHVLACVWANGPRPEGFQASHVCEHAWCVNPHHLLWELATDNHWRRSRRFKRTGQML